jgi:acyl carrier protein
MKVIKNSAESPTDTTEDVVGKIRDWLCSKNPKAADIGLDDNIIENRVIDSLQFITFLLFIEEVLGRKLRSDEVEEESFRTIRTIQDTFFA